MTERTHDPGSDDDTTPEGEGPQEVLDAAEDELEIPADGTNEG